MSSPYELLLGLALLAEKQRKEEKILQGWTGVLVKLEQNYLLIEREMIKEIVTLSLTTPVIDKRKWLTGLMSHEGALLPLIELRKMFNPQAHHLGLKDRQVIVIKEKSGVVGLLVDQIIGGKDYWMDDPALADVNSQPDDLFTITFSYKDQIINILDHHKFSVTIGLTKH